MFRIEQHKKQLEKACPGDSVSLSIKGIARDEKVQPGKIFYVQKEGDLNPSRLSLGCGCCAGSTLGILKPGYALVVFCRITNIVTKIVWKMGKCKLIMVCKTSMAI